MEIVRAMEYTKNQEHIDTDETKYKISRKKKLQERFLIGVLTIICCTLIVILIVTFKSGHHPISQNCLIKDNERVFKNNTIKFIHWSDIHYDPFYNETVPSKFFCRQQLALESDNYLAPYGRIGCDSPLNLVENTLNAMKNITEDEEIKFMLLTGDLSGHRMWTNFSGADKVLDNIAIVSSKVHSTFPKIPVFPVIGNNDLPGHYVLPNSTSDWYKKLLTFWSPLILCSGCPGYTRNLIRERVLQETFLEGGYYNTSIADGKIVVLALNSLYWSLAVERSVETDRKALKQLVWLEEQLMLARDHGQKAILISHIPAGVDTYSEKAYWFSNYTDVYVTIVARNYSNLIIGQFFAHTHKDDYRLHSFSSNISFSQHDPLMSFLLLAPAISPVYHNNPAFRMLSLDVEKLSLIDFTQYFMDLVMATEFSNPVWQLDYTFSEKYKSSNPFIDAERINELNQQLLNQTSNKFWKSYVFSRETNYQPMKYSRFTLYCAMRFVHFQSFQQCRKKYIVPGG